MTDTPVVDGVLVQWGERLFYPPNRRVHARELPRLRAPGSRASAIRGRIVATIRRAPQVMVKVTGGGRGMAAIAAHFRYISKSGRLEIEDDRGEVHVGRESLHDLIDQWRHGGARIPEHGHRREAFNIMLSMPRGVDASIVQRAAREFAADELAEHRYVMVLHDHQANPHVHLSVRATGRDGSRLNPRKADLQRWRETFAARLRGWGIDAEATRQAVRGASRGFEERWQRAAKAEGRLRSGDATRMKGGQFLATRGEALQAWAHIVEALKGSDLAADRLLAQDVLRFLQRSAAFRALVRGVGRDAVDVQRAPPVHNVQVQRERGIDIGR